MRLTLEMFLSQNLLRRVVFVSLPFVGILGSSCTAPPYAVLVKRGIPVFMTTASGGQTSSIVESASAYTLCLHPTAVFAHNDEMA